MDLKRRVQSPEFGVSIGEGHQFARYAFLTRGVDAWADARLLTRPDILYDISAIPLVYQFYVLSQNECIGTIRISADTRLDVPVLSIQYARSLRPDIDGAIRLLQPRAAFLMPGHRVIDCYPVVYSYPKTGIQFVFVPEGEGDAYPYPASVIMDLETMRPVAELPEGAAGDDVDGHEAYSLIAVSERRAKLRMHRFGWKAQADGMQDILALYDQSEGGGGGLPVVVDEHVLPRQAGSPEGVFPAYGQIETYHCAIASAQMVIEYLTGEHISQRELEVPFRKGAFGTTNAAQIDGYRKLLEAYPFQPTGLDETPTAEEAAAVINAGLPMKSGVPRHARVCCGYRKLRVENPETGGVVEDLELLIHDPWPPQEGKVYWEGWTDIVHTNFIYITEKVLRELLKGE